MHDIFGMGTVSLVILALIEDNFHLYNCVEAETS